MMVYSKQKRYEKNFKLWVHANSYAERLDLSNKKAIEIFFDQFESIPLLKNWHSYLSEDINNVSEFKLGESNEAISLCIEIDSNNEIVNWSFHLTLVKCSLIVENNHLEALINRKGKTLH